MEKQSAYIAGALALGFVLWLAARGRLSAYTAVLWGPTAVPAPAVSGSGSSSSGSSSGGNILSQLGSAAASWATHEAASAALAAVVI